MGRGPRMAWPPSAVLEGGAHERSEVGGIAPKGRTSRGPLPAGDGPTCSRPGRTCERTKMADIVPREVRQDLWENEKGRYRICAGTTGPARERKQAKSYLRRDGRTCGRTKRVDSVSAQGRWAFEALHESYAFTIFATSEEVV